MNKVVRLCVILSIVSLLGSCTYRQRPYRRGYGYFTQNANGNTKIRYRLENPESYAINKDGDVIIEVDQVQMRENYPFKDIVYDRKKRLLILSGSGIRRTARDRAKTFPNSTARFIIRTSPSPDFQNLYWGRKDQGSEGASASADALKITIREFLDDDEIYEQYSWGMDALSNQYFRVKKDYGSSVVPDSVDAPNMTIREFLDDDELLPGTTIQKIFKGYRHKEPKSYSEQPYEMHIPYYINENGYKLWINWSSMYWGGQRKYVTERAWWMFPEYIPAIMADIPTVPVHFLLNQIYRCIVLTSGDTV